MTRRHPQSARRVSTLVGLLFGLAGMGILERRRRAAGPRRGPRRQRRSGAWAISLYVLMLAVTTARLRADLRPGRRPRPAARRARADVGRRAGRGARADLRGAAGCPHAAGRGRRRRADARRRHPVRQVHRRGPRPRLRPAGRRRGRRQLPRPAGRRPRRGRAGAGAPSWRCRSSGALVVPLLWRALPTGGSGARLDVVGARGRACTAAGMVLLVQSPSAGRWSPRSARACSCWACRPCARAYDAAPTASCRSR